MPKNSWRPRHGQRLEQPSSPGRLHNLSRKALEKVPRIVLHPLWGILLATLLAVTWRGEITLRSSGLLLAALWLSADLWSWLLRDHKHKWIRLWRFVIGWGGTSLLLIAVMASMRFWMDGKLEEIRRDVFNQLTIDYSIPPGAEDSPTKSVITVSNGSVYEISAKNRIACQLNLAINEIGGTLETDNIATAENPNGTYALISGPLGIMPIPDGAPLHAGGDSQSNSCLSGWSEANHFVCVDMTIVFQYVLQDQPDIRQAKSLRVSTYGSRNNGFRWYKESLDAKTSYCRRFAKFPLAKLEGG